MERRFNIKATFRDGRLDRLEFGDFGAATRPPGKRVDRMKCEDCFIAWPVDPQSTGRSGIASLLDVPVTDRFFREC